MPITKANLRDATVIVAVLLVAALLLLLPLLERDEGTHLVVTTPDGSFFYSLSDDREWTLESNGILLHIRICDGRVTVYESTCPDRVCVLSGAISRPGETILCAPAGVTLTVKGGDADVDFVAG